MSTAAQHPRPLLGLRKRPGRLALAAMRVPRPLYHHGLGRLLGHTFLLITHEGRTTRRRRETVAMALTWNADTRQAVVFSAWGETQWIRNLRAHPALEIQIGAQTFTPQQHFLTADEAVAAAVAFRRRHPWRLRLFSLILGWGDLGTEAALRDFVASRPFVAFQPAASEAGSGTVRTRGRTRGRFHRRHSPGASGLIARLVGNVLPLREKLWAVAAAISCGF